LLSSPHKLLEVLRLELGSELLYRRCGIGTCETTDLRHYRASIARKVRPNIITAHRRDCLWRRAGTCGIGAKERVDPSDPIELRLEVGIGANHPQSQRRTEPAILEHPYDRRLSARKIEALATRHLEGHAGRTSAQVLRNPRECRSGGNRTLRVNHW